MDSDYEEMLEKNQQHLIEEKQREKEEEER